MSDVELKALSTDPATEPTPGPDPSIIIPTEIKLSELDIEFQTYEELIDNENVWYVTIAASSLYGRDYRVTRKFDRYNSKGVQILEKDQPWGDESKIVSIIDIFQNSEIKITA